MLDILEPCTIIRVQSWDGSSVPMTLESTFGLAWPTSVGTLASGRVVVICLGPTDWLVVSETLDDARLMLTLGGAFSGTSFRATNVSSSLVRMHLGGPHARTLLSKGCSLDLQVHEFTPGRSAQTRFAGMPVIVRCLEPYAFELIVTSSHLEYCHAWLADAALEFDSATA